MKEELSHKLCHAYRLAENGASELASRQLRFAVEDLCNLPLGDKSESLCCRIEHTGHRTGIEVAFQYAEHFYKQGDKRAARGWLHKAKYDAKQISLDITKRISRLKKTYRDRRPIIW